MKALLIALVMLLVSYGPIELTWCIIAWGLAGDKIFELCFMWLFWLGAIFVLARFMEVGKKGQLDR